MSELILDGCTLEPLMGYLKALGVLRLVGEQKDPEALGRWREGVFVLESALDCDGLLRFFLEEYRPTPIVAPWAGGSGFFGNDNRAAVDAIAASRSERMAGFAARIRDVRGILEREGVTTKPADETKARLLRSYRNRLDDDHFVAWMDAALVVQRDGQTFPPLLGTGGNDGRLDFAQNLMQRLVTLGLPAGALNRAAEGWLRQSLLGAATPGLLGAAVGQFDPGRAGGPNATTGLEGDSLVNPWDFVLMLEGSLLLGGAAVRRFDVNRGGRGSFPFTVRAASVGYASGAVAEEGDSRGEIWLPVWTNPTTVRELAYVFAEGRAGDGRRKSRDGVDFARAVATLGTDRGFAAFTRYGFLKRSGKAFVAAPLGTFPVQQRRAVDLLREVDGWLARFRRACAGDAPARFGAVRRRVETAVFDLCRYANDHDSATWVRAVLRALGAAERELSIGSFARKPAKGSPRPRISPAGGLSAAWIAAAADRPAPAEFRIARGVAFLNPGTRHALHIRRYLEPVERKGKFWAWGEGGGHVVWGGGDLAHNLGALLIRRLMDAEKVGKAASALDGRYAAPLADIVAFLHGFTDDDRLEDLIWGLSLVEAENGRRSKPRSDAKRSLPTKAAWTGPVARAEADGGQRTGTRLPRAYALLKLALLPGSLRWRNGVLHVSRSDPGDAAGGTAVKPESAIPAKLRAGDVQGACEIAARRLRSSGFSPVGGFLADGSRRSIDWSTGGVSPDRLLAALLFPVRDGDVDRLAGLVLRRPSPKTLA